MILQFSIIKKNFSWSCQDILLLVLVLVNHSKGFHFDHKIIIDFMVKMAEWLRRWIVNPLGSARMGSNPIFVVFLIGTIVKLIATCSLDSAIRIKISVEEGILKT